MMRSKEGSSERLLELCGGYFFFYVLTGIAVKYFTGIREPPMTQIAYLFNNTLGGNLVALLIVVALGWIRRPGPELWYIIPSGICTAVVIPTTTLMYTLPITVMVAMVIMRGSIIVISRLVDEVQIRQGILKKRVYAQENIAMVFALLAVAVNILAPARGKFEFIGDRAAMTILTAYLIAYTIRIYIMNYYKNTRKPGEKQDNRKFFAYEQIAATGTMALVLAYLLKGPAAQATAGRLFDLRTAVAAPDLNAILSGIPFGLVAFFSVFIFMFPARTATFSGLVNRLTSLVAGTVSTLLMAFLWKQRWPGLNDWISLLFIGVAVGFLTVAEQRRTRELKAGTGSESRVQQ